MKQFDDYWDENWNEQEWAGCKRACRACYEDAKREGMLAAADIVTDSARGFRLDREGVANKIREAAK